jgi:hypothetical protein
VTISDKSLERLKEYDKHLADGVAKLRGEGMCKCGRCDVKRRVLLQMVEQLRMTLIEPLHDGDTYECLASTLSVAAILEDYVGRYVSEPFWAKYTSPTLTEKGVIPKKGMGRDDRITAFQELTLLAQHYQMKSDKVSALADDFSATPGQATVSGTFVPLGEVIQRIIGDMQKKKMGPKPRKSRKKKPD